MRNTTLAIDEQTLDDARKYSRKMGYSFNAWVNKLIRDAISRSPKKAMSRLLELSDTLAGNSQGRQWRKDDIYER